MIICEVLDVTPYELLSGAEHTGNRSRDNNTYVISKETEIGMLVETYQKLNTDAQKRVMGYLEALRELTQKIYLQNTYKRTNNGIRDENVGRKERER